LSTHSDRSRETRIYVSALSATALVAALVLLARGQALEDPWTVAALALTNALAERSGVQVSRRTEMSIALLPTLFAAVLFGPLAAAIVNAASMLGDPELFARRDPARAPRLKWATYTSTRFITGAVAGVIAMAVIDATNTGLGGLLAATLLSALAAEGLDVLGASATLRVVRGESMLDNLKLLAPIVLTSVPIYGPLVAILALAYLEVSPWTLPLFLIPSLGAQRLYKMYQAQRTLAEKLEDANVSFAVALVTTLEASDAYTAGHSRAVAIYSRDIARRMGLPDEDCDRAFLCGLVHDIGKVGLPASLLGKEGALTLEERRQMQDHSIIGERILREVAAYDDVAKIVRHHHERIDGEGYPDGIGGDAIPLLSKVIAVADAYNAMTSDRPYRDGMPPRVARLRLAQAVENQFDTTVVAAFEAILATSEEAYRTAQRDDFRPGQPSVSDEAESRTAAVDAA
jgi:putative nucleotidyltransferase with HDIG domain